MTVSVSPTWANGLLGCSARLRALLFGGALGLVAGCNRAEERALERLALTLLAIFLVVVLLELALLVSCAVLFAKNLHNASARSRTLGTGLGAFGTLVHLGWFGTTLEAVGLDASLTWPAMGLIVSLPCLVVSLRARPAVATPTHATVNPMTWALLKVVWKHGALLDGAQRDARAA